MIAARQLDYIGKLIQGTNLQEEWLRHAATKHNELEDHKNYWKELHLQEPTPTIQRCPFKTLKHIDHYGSLKHWIHEASNKKYWSQLIKRLTHPETPLPEQPEEWGPLPSWQVWHANTINEDESNNTTCRNRNKADRSFASFWVGVWPKRSHTTMNFPKKAMSP